MFEWTTSESNIYVFELDSVWKIWDNAIADVIHFCLTYLDLRYLMIGSVFPRLFLMMMFEVLMKKT